MPKNNLIILLVHHVWFVGHVFVEPGYGFFLKHLDGKHVFFVFLII